MPPCHRRLCGDARSSNSITANAAGRLAMYTRSWRSFAARPWCRGPPTAGTICGSRAATEAYHIPSKVAARARPFGRGNKKLAKIYRRAAPSADADTPIGGVRVGPQPRYHRDYDRRAYRGYGYDRRYRSYGYDRGYRGCRTVTIQRDDGSVRRVRRCG